MASVPALTAPELRLPLESVKKLAPKSAASSGSPERSITPLPLRDSLESD